MIDLAILLVVNSLACCGLYLATQNGMIMDWFGRMAYNYGGRLYPALCGCITCMASIWSIPYWWYWSDTDNWPLFIATWILYVFALAGLNTVIYNQFLDDGK